MNDIYRIGFHVISKDRPGGPDRTGRLTSEEVTRSIVRPFSNMMRDATGLETTTSRENVIISDASDSAQMIEDAALSSLESLFRSATPASYAIVSDWIADQGTRRLYRGFSQR